MEGESLQVRGVLSTDMQVEPNDGKGKFEHHYLGVRERSYTDTCEQMGSVWPEWLTDNDYSDEKCALGKAAFDSDGYAIFRNRDSPA